MPMLRFTSLLNPVSSSALSLKDKPLPIGCCDLSCLLCLATAVSADGTESLWPSWTEVAAIGGSIKCFFQFEVEEFFYCTFYNFRKCQWKASVRKPVKQLYINSCLQQFEWTLVTDLWHRSDTPTWRGNAFNYINYCVTCNNPASCNIPITRSKHFKIPIKHHNLTLPYIIGINLKVKPIRFITFMDKVSRRSHGIEGVQSGDLRIKFLLFADYVILLASSVCDLHVSLDRECGAARMRITASKSEAMILSQKKTARTSKWRSSSTLRSCSQVKE